MPSALLSSNTHTRYPHPCQVKTRPVLPISSRRLSCPVSMDSAMVSWLCHWVTIPVARLMRPASAPYGDTKMVCEAGLEPATSRSRWPTGAYTSFRYSQHNLVCPEGIEPSSSGLQSDVGTSITTDTYLVDLRLLIPLAVGYSRGPQSNGATRQIHWCWGTAANVLDFRSKLGPDRRS